MSAEVLWVLQALFFPFSFSKRFEIDKRPSNDHTALYYYCEEKSLSRSLVICKIALSNCSQHCAIMRFKPGKWQKAGIFHLEVNSSDSDHMISRITYMLCNPLRLLQHISPIEAISEQKMIDNGPKSSTITKMKSKHLPWRANCWEHLSQLFLHHVPCCNPYIFWSGQFDFLGLLSFHAQNPRPSNIRISWMLCALKEKHSAFFRWE